MASVWSESFHGTKKTGDCFVERLDHLQRHRVQKYYLFKQSVTFVSTATSDKTLLKGHCETFAYNIGVWFETAAML